MPTSDVTPNMITGDEFNMDEATARNDIGSPSKRPRISSTFTASDLSNRAMRSESLSVESRASTPRAEDSQEDSPNEGPLAAPTTGSTINVTRPKTPMRDTNVLSSTPDSGSAASSNLSSLEKTPSPPTSPWRHLTTNEKRQILERPISPVPRASNPFLPDGKPGHVTLTTSKIYTAGKHISAMRDMLPGDRAHYLSADDRFVRDGVAALLCLPTNNNTPPLSPSTISTPDLEAARAFLNRIRAIFPHGTFWSRLHELLHLTQEVENGGMGVEELVRRFAEAVHYHPDLVEEIGDFSPDEEGARRAWGEAREEAGRRLHSIEADPFVSGMLDGG